MYEYAEEPKPIKSSASISRLSLNPTLPGGWGEAGKGRLSGPEVPPGVAKGNIPLREMESEGSRPRP